MPPSRLLFVISLLLVHFGSCDQTYLRKNNNEAQFQSNLLCNACKDMVHVIQRGESIVDSGIQIFLEQVALAVCIWKKIQPEVSVCRGAINEMVPPIVESIVSRYLDSDEICPLVKMCPQVYERLNDLNDAMEIIKDKPQDSEWPQPSGNERVRMIHISDLHFDAKYKEDAKANCDFPLCCREESGEVLNGDVKAGYWGTLHNCNIPYRTLEQLFSFIKSDIYKEGEKIMLLWTGDNTSHDIWEQSKESNLRSTEAVTNLLKQTFPNGDVVIVPQVGNHESYPVNVFDYKSGREQQFRSFVADIWSEWLGPEQTDLFRERGFYKLEIEDWNLKVIAFDSQVCNPENWYLIKDPTDPSGFLEWMRQELYESESKDQVVYLSAHIYTQSCLTSWGVRFKALVDRFSRIIRAQVYGHSHGERFILYRGYSKNETLSAAFVSSSVTTYSFKNPSFRVFDIDRETMIPLNYFQYRLNLTDANLHNREGPLLWENVFNFLEEYDSPTMHPRDMEKVAEKILVDEDMARKFSINSNSGYGPDKPLYQRGYYCSIMSALDVEEQICNTGQAIKSIENKVMDAVLGSWRRKKQH